ncbi:MAG: hypothetical protein ACI4UG_05405, partial [Candidatus Onthovivens sp.]
IHWSIILIIIIVFITSFIFLFNSMFGFLKIGENKIYVPNDLTFENLRIQHKETINIDDIIAIEFLEEECTSNGSKISWRYTGIPPYLKLIMKDESIKRIYLGKYSYKTWIKIEKLIINNRDILVLKDANSFVKFKKTGVL